MLVLLLHFNCNNCVIQNDFFSVSLVVCSGNKFTISTTHILLMTVVIVLITLLLEGSEKPKRMVVVDKKKGGDHKED